MDSPPPYMKILGGQYNINSKISDSGGPPGYATYTPPEMPYSYYGSTPQKNCKLPPGVCPACRLGRLEVEYSYSKIIFFCCLPCPCGKHKKCNHCSAYFR